eukprot:CAMPEP_0115354650 /NCGR_PEP_ID=MMETSP0270-20121206/98698_1 /TAXON_ID=71861 /ORGANISM="Scrippsiella trochoidea, Strain CCMP3099" /LENGTH=38 /DNA_ID= /DNA_START= /DNA_END= /DNA_ORIENTATION=
MAHVGHSVGRVVPQPPLRFGEAMYDSMVLFQGSLQKPG